jgi:predicted RNA binding protein YcfA (HicA-like mRNA interferase family)
MGIKEVRQKGSHIFLASFDKKHSSVLPMHTTDLPRGTIRAILRDLDISIEKYQNEM